MADHDISNTSSGAPSTERDRGRPEAGISIPPKEIGGPKGPDPARYGDWERGGKCVDF